MQVQIDRYQSDLNTDYHEIEKRYEDQFIQLKVYINGCGLRELPLTLQ